MESSRPKVVQNSTQTLEEESGLETCLKTAGLAESELLPSFNLRSLIQLTRTNHGIHGLFVEPRQREILMDKLMAHLANIIVNEPTLENIEELKKILRAYPELLTRKIKKVVFKQTGQEYWNYSLLQLAYAEGDDAMCRDVFKPCLEREEIRKQLDEKFPEGNEEDLIIEIQIAGLLTTAIQAISIERFNHRRDAENKLILSPATLAAIDSFRDAFNALQPKVMDKGRRFRLNTLREVYAAFVGADVQWRHAENPTTLFEDGIVSSVLGFVPVNDAQGFSQYKYSLHEEPHAPFERRMTLRNVNINFYDFLHGPSDFSSLSGSCVDVVAGSESKEYGCSTPRAAQDAIQSHLNQKETNLQNFRYPPENTLGLGQ